MPHEFFCIWIHYNIYRRFLSMLVRYWKITWLWTWVHVQILDNMIVGSNYEQYLTKNLFNLILTYMISINIGYYFNQNNTLCKSIWGPFAFTFSIHFFIHLGLHYWFFPLNLKSLATSLLSISCFFTLACCNGFLFFCQDGFFQGFTSSIVTYNC